MLLVLKRKLSLFIKICFYCVRFNLPTLTIFRLPIFLDRLAGPVWAVVISVSCILLFGEIVPQAICTKYGLAIGSATRYFVWLLIAALFVIAWPISHLLDCILGTHGDTFYRRTELKALIKIVRHFFFCTFLYIIVFFLSSRLLIYRQHEKENAESKHGLSPDEVKILRGALDLTHKTLRQVMTPIDDVFMVEESDVLDQQLMQRLWDKGHSRVPVYKNSRRHVVGVLLVKSLVIVNANDKVTVSEAGYLPIPHLDEHIGLYDVINLFQLGKSHIGIVVSGHDGISILGIVTLEDVVEELIQEGV
jgi:metal transporter CNNM